MCLCASGFGPVKEDNYLDFLEVCAGSHTLSSAANEYGLRSMALDVSWLECCCLTFHNLHELRTEFPKVSYSRHHDILCAFGMLLAFQCLRRVRSHTGPVED